MYNKIHRDSKYLSSLKSFLCEKYHINAVAITPAKRGYYGETWRVGTADNAYFVKLDYFPRHQKIFQNSLSVIEYLCNSGIDFINKVIKTCDGEIYVHFNSAVLAVFEWIDGENMETNCTKTSEYQMLCKIYPLTKQGFDIPSVAFLDSTAICFYEKWEKLKRMPQSKAGDAACSILKRHSEKLSHRAARLSYFAALCKKDTTGFFITHGDAGGNFLAGNGKNYLVDWDEVRYAPPERDAWVMCCRGWAGEIFNNTLKENGIAYQLRPERIAFYCYYMYFLYLGEFLEDFTWHGIIESIEEYFGDGYWIEERIAWADKV